MTVQHHEDDSSSAGINDNCASLKQNGMDLHSSLTMLHKVLGPSSPGVAFDYDQLNDNKLALLQMFQGNAKNIDMLDVSLEDLRKCVHAGFLTECEETAARQALTDAYIRQRIDSNKISESAEELAICHSRGLIPSEELSTAAFKLYSHHGDSETFNLKHDLSISGSLSDSATREKCALTGHTLPIPTPLNSYGYPTTGATAFPTYIPTTSYSAAHFAPYTTYPTHPYGGPLHSTPFTLPTSNSSASLPHSTTSGSYSVSNSKSTSNKDKDKEKDKSEGTNGQKAKRVKVLTADDHQLLAQQVKKLMEPLPNNLPEQTHPPIHGRGFGASAKPFNADNSLTATLSSERLSWRCRWCYCSGKFTPALRKGPTGAKTLCNSCGMWYARRGTLPVERWREFANPKGLNGGKIMNGSSPPVAQMSHDDTHFISPFVPARDDYAQALESLGEEVDRKSVV